MSKIEIGSRYSGPCFDKPTLRQLPRHWWLHGVKPNRWLWPVPWYRNAPLWGKVVLLMWLLLGIVQLAKGIV